MTDIELKEITVDMERLEDFHFRSRNTWGHTVDVDDSGAYDDSNGQGTGPMELLLVALGTCSGFDVVSILKKGRHELQSFMVSVSGRKPKDSAPSIYKEIDVRFSLESDASPDRVRRAIELSLGKYCSVAETLRPTADIRYEFSLNGESFKGDSV